MKSRLGFPESNTMLLAVNHLFYFSPPAALKWWEMPAGGRDLTPLAGVCVCSNPRLFNFTNITLPVLHVLIEVNGLIIVSFSLRVSCLGFKSENQHFELCLISNRRATQYESLGTGSSGMIKTL